MRVIGPRSRDAPQRNKAHMEYIGRRPGVVLNEHMKHGLFGAVDGKKAEDIQSMRELSRYIEAKTQAGTIAYRAVISLEEDDAMRMGYDDPDKWRELVRAQLTMISEKIGIPLHSLEYTAAIHRDKGHPHVHILFWDKEQEIKKKAYVHKNVSNSIRVGLIKHVFEEEMTALQQIKNEARAATLDNMGGFFGGFAETFACIGEAEYGAAKDRLKLDGDLADSRLIYGRFKTADIKELSGSLSRLMERLPKSGRLQYKLMPREVKDEIAAFIEKVLEKNADCNREFKKYVQAAIELSKYYSDSPESHAKAGKSAYDEMMKRLGNVVLREIKRMSQAEKDTTQTAELKTAYKRQAMEGLIFSLFQLLARSADAENRKVSHFQQTGELSKQAKKELALRKENSNGYEWE